MSVMFTGLINLRALDTDNVPNLDSWGWEGRYLCQDPSRGRWRDPSPPYTLHPTPYTLHPTPYTLNPKP
jgi:hypothetical protein